MKILIIPENACPECAFKHPVGDPHNLNTVFYKWQFREKNNREPTWWDAIAHCSEQTKAYWVKALREMGEEI